MDEEKIVVQDVEDEKGSHSGSGSTASHSSEEFVKVNQDDASLEDAASDTPREDVEDIPSLIKDEPPSGGFGEKLMKTVDPRAILNENMSSDNFLKDYYDQLPSETATFQSEESGELLGQCYFGTLDNTSTLQPEVLNSQVSVETELPSSPEGTLASEICRADHSSFEPVPVANFEAVDSTPTDGAVAVAEVAFREEAESQPAVELEMKLELGSGIIVEDVSEEEMVPADNAEVTNMPTPPVVEDIIDAKPKPTPASADIPPSVVDLIHWRDIKNTAGVFSFLLVVSVSLCCYSVISVFAYAGLSLLTVTLAVRLYKFVLQTLNGTQQPHPFQAFLDADVTLSPERIAKYMDTISDHLNCTVTAGRDLIFVKNTASSLKFGVFLWLMTYLGAVFNGLTLFIIGFVLLFTVPPVYEKYQTQIDDYYNLARDKVRDVMEKVKAKFPGKKEPKEKAQ